MNDTTYKKLETLAGLPNNATSYPWSYDTVLIQEYYELLGYKPVFLRNLEDKEEKENSDFILNALYRTLKQKGVESRWSI